MTSPNLIIIRTQQDWDNLPDSFGIFTEIYILNYPIISIIIKRCPINGIIKVYGSGYVEVWGSIYVEAYHSSLVEAYDSSVVNLAETKVTFIDNRIKNKNENEIISKPNQVKYFILQNGESIYFDSKELLIENLKNIKYDPKNSELKVFEAKQLEVKIEQTINITPVFTT